MRKQQTIQLLQFVFVWVFVWLFVVFVMKSSFVDFILKYWLYFLIVSFSYFYYYSIQYEPDKKYELIRNIIIFWNVYLFFHIFFRPLLNISHQLFVLLWLIVLWILWTTKLETRWKYVLQIIWWFFSFFIMISGMFYFYPELPDIDWFLEWRNCEILVLWVDDRIKKTEAYIRITDIRNDNDFEIYPFFKKTLNDDVKISYPSVKKQRNENMIIKTPEWDLFWLFPQSEIQLEFSWWKVKKVSKINWKIWFLSWVFDSGIEYSWDIEMLDQKQQERIIWIQSWYKSELVSHLKWQIAKSNIAWANNTIMYNIDGKLIQFLSKMFPNTFGNNLRNYKEFQKYFGWFDNWVDLGRYSLKHWSQSFGLLWWKMKENMNVWKNNTYGWFKKPEKR